MSEQTSPRVGRSALVAALAYAVAGLVWIFVGDSLVQTSDDSDALQTTKGVAYVLLTALLLGMGMYRAGRARVHAEADAGQLRRFRRTILDSLADAVFVVEVPSRRIVDCNPAAVEMFGWDREELVGSTTEKLHADGASFRRFDELGATHLATRESAFRTEYELKRRDGGLFPTEHAVTYLRDDLGQVTGAVSIVRDITERVRLEEEARQAQKMEAIGQTASGVAHDFNNVLAVVLAGAEILREDVPESVGVHDLIEEIRDAGRRGAALAGRLLMFSRSRVVEPEVLRVDDAVRGLEKMLRRAVGGGVRLDVGLGCGDARVRVDPIGLDQLLLNLAVNARDAMPDGGEFSIRTRCDGAEVLIEVEDTGTGIDAETRERMFDPFFTTKGPGRGTGLGLSTVSSIVRQMTGDISVESEVGRGTTFRLRIPLTSEPVRSAPMPEETRAVAGRGETVLLVDEDDDARQAVRQVLERGGYRVLAASGPGEALLLAEQHATHVSLLVTDLVMPLLGGAALAARVAGSVPDLRAVFLTGHRTHDEVPESDAPILRKPVSPIALLTAVRRELDAGTTPPSSALPAIASW